MKKILSLCLLVAPSLLVAQEQTDSITTHRLNEVEVVADYLRAQPQLSRSSVSLDKLPLSISSLQVNQLKNRNLYLPTDAIRFIGGGSGIGKSYGAFLQLNVRGFDYAPISVDGMRDERTTFNSYPLSDLSEVESLELLKGPASVLQGHSAVGGALLLSRRKAKAQKEIEASLNYGSWNYMRASALVGNYLGAGWSGLFLATYSKEDGWRDLGDKTLKLYGTLNGRWSKDEVDIRVSHNNDFYGTETGLPPTLSSDVYTTQGDQLYLKAGEVEERIRKNRSVRYNNSSDFMYHRNLNGSVRWVHTFTPQIKLVEHASANWDDIDYFSTEELNYVTSDKTEYAHYFKGKGGKKQYIDLSRVQFTFPLRFEHIAKTFQNQLTLDAKFYTGFIKHNLTSGVDVSYMRRVTYKGYNLEGSDPDVYGITQPWIVSAYEPKGVGELKSKFSKASPSHTFSSGFFVQDIWEFSPQIQAMTALRYDLYSYRSSGDIAVADGKHSFQDVDTYPNKINDTALTYRLGLVYTPIKQLSLYSSIANYFNPDRTFARPNRIYIDNSGNEIEPKAGVGLFKPRSGYQIELGTRATPLKWLELSASVYHILQNNTIVGLGREVRQVNGKDVTYSLTGQIGQITSQGVEAEAKLSPIEGLNLSFGYSYTDAKYGDNQIDKYRKKNENDGIIKPGTAVDGISKHKAYSLGEYTIQRGLLKSLSLNYAFSYQGERKIRQNHFPAYTLLDLGIAYQIVQNLRLSANVYNVLNTESYQEALGNQMVPNRPTNFRIGLSYKP
ncbi:TonB-dependent siderophore receptor [Porphyromonas sp. COT-290 OH3588]|uniref:TonB-dependent receptor n=1 Tax=Porphyromonas sp. COT-290 OH3588 TaxID=1515617 RepID=UPI00052C39A5|nr:TonB-dependent receptor [Porphyromonas sp. COT-290 OH3588]KGO01187.1 hypothetical protein HQ48_03685 [Porphyromonas sp. COT-290 OH3588]